MRSILTQSTPHDHRDLNQEIHSIHGHKPGRSSALLDRLFSAARPQGAASGAAANKRRLWLLRPFRNGPWEKELIDAGSGGFEHASILLDLDGDKRDELYVASDNQKEVRRYDWTPKGWRHEVLLKYNDKLSRLTWNIMAVPTALLPAPGVALTDTADAASFTKIEPPKPKESSPPAVAKTSEK